MKLTTVGFLCVLITGTFMAGYGIRPVAATHTGLPVIRVSSPAYGTGNVIDESLTPGSEFAIAVNVANSWEIFGYRFALYYDVAILSVSQVSFEGTVFGASAFKTIEELPGRLSVQVFSTKAAPGDGVLVSIALLVVGFGTSPLGISDDKLYGAGLTEILHEKIGGCFRNSQLPQPKLDFSLPPSPGFYETSEFMIGRVAVGIIIVESDGPLYNWTDAEVQKSVSGITDAMAWWSAQEPDARLEFFFDVHTRVPTSYEPIEMPWFHYDLWGREAMAHLGYSDNSVFQQVWAYNNDLREQFSADWAFTILLADSDPYKHFGNFGGGTLYEFAYFGGPFFVMSRFSMWAWNSAQYEVAVPAHATGHMFRATDEYNGFLEYGGYLSAPDVDGQVNLMNQNTLLLQESTRQQVGWRDCDGNHLLDPIDTFPAIQVEPPPAPISDSSYSFRGTAVDAPSPNMSGGRDVTINELVAVRYSFDQGTWHDAVPVDGVFDEALENFTIPLPELTDGDHILTIQSENSVGNSSPFATTFRTQHIVEGTLDIDPDSLVSRSMGRFLTAYIELPMGLDVSDIYIVSVLLNDTLHVSTSSPTTVGDHDSDGNPDLMVKFNLQDVLSLVDSPGDYVLSVAGNVITGNDSRSFRASTSVRVLFPGDLNGDLRVDMIDASLLAKAFGSTQGDADWNQNADFSQDGRIDIVDAAIIASNFGATF